MSDQNESRGEQTVLERLKQIWYGLNITPTDRQSFLQELRDGETKVRITDSEIRFSNK